MNLAAEERTDAFHLVLRKGQHSAMEAFYDKLKINSANCGWVKEHLDPSLRVSDYDDEKLR